MIFFSILNIMNLHLLFFLPQMALCGFPPEVSMLPLPTHIVPTTASMSQSSICATLASNSGVYAVLGVSCEFSLLLSCFWNQESFICIGPGTCIVYGCDCCRCVCHMKKRHGNICRSMDSFFLLRRFALDAGGCLAQHRCMDMENGALRDKKRANVESIGVSM